MNPWLYSLPESVHCRIHEGADLPWRCGQTDDLYGVAGAHSALLDLAGDHGPAALDREHVLDRHQQRRVNGSPQGRFFVNRGKIVGKPVENLADNPLRDGAI